MLWLLATFYILISYHHDATGVGKSASADSASHVTGAAPTVNSHQPVPATASPQPSNVTNASRTSSNIMGLAQKFQVNKDSNGSLPRPASVAIMGSSYNSLVNGPAAASNASSTTADTALSPEPNASGDGKPEAKNPNSVVNKLLGKYNRKSFISTARPSLVMLTSSETEESKGTPHPSSAPESQQAASAIQNNVPSFAEPAKVETKSVPLHNQSMPVMPSAAADNQRASNVSVAIDNVHASVVSFLFERIVCCVLRTWLLNFLVNKQRTLT